MPAAGPGTAGYQDVPFGLAPKAGPRSDPENGGGRDGGFVSE
jgi:hypothetical protein